MNLNYELLIVVFNYLIFTLRNHRIIVCIPLSEMMFLSTFFDSPIDALNDFDGGVRQVLGENGTAGIWATYPKPFLSLQTGLGDQV